ncbi:MAG: thrombospondin type 3 repeat-containing protein, partial [Planctomycetes bacterium]|nr:thrombospondin type 3 repeat-containing protein [Planctomycetota bacterium]
MRKSPVRNAPVPRPWIRAARRHTCFRAAARRRICRTTPAISVAAKSTSLSPIARVRTVPVLELPVPNPHSVAPPPRTTSVSASSGSRTALPRVITACCSTSLVSRRTLQRLRSAGRTVVGAAVRPPPHRARRRIRPLARLWDAPSTALSENIHDGNDGGCGDDPDVDGASSLCGDNCPDDANPGQEDCDGDGEGDACEANDDDKDGDGDGVCNGVDNCPLTPNPGQENADGGEGGDACDDCPNSSPDDSDNDTVCDDVDICFPGDDRVDTDNDGVPDDCDVCPGSDDNVPGARDDADGDGVLNCDDRCPGVDDVVFAPQCESAIPTTSQWGLIV